MRIPKVYACRASQIVAVGVCGLSNCKIGWCVRPFELRNRSVCAAFRIAHAHDLGIRYLALDLALGRAGHFLLW